MSSLPLPCQAPSTLVFLCFLTHANSVPTSESLCQPAPWPESSSAKICMSGSFLSLGSWLKCHLLREAFLVYTLKEPSLTPSYSNPLSTYSGIYYQSPPQCLMVNKYLHLCDIIFVQCLHFIDAFLIIIDFITTSLRAQNKQQTNETPYGYKLKIPSHPSIPQPHIH